MLLKDPKTFTLQHRAMFAMFIFSMVYLFGMVKLEEYAGALNTEIETSKILIGDQSSANIVTGAQRIFGLFDQGLLPMRDNLDQANKSNKYRVLSKMGDNVLEAADKVRLLIYQMCYRLFLLKYWFLTGLPLVIALIYEGVKIRSIKMYEFGNTSDSRMRLWSKFIGFTVIILNIYLIFPYSGEFGALFPPTVMLIIGIVFRNMLTHLSKSF
ncbi:DUF4400 domain-containing protein [Photobacterium sp. ZSDE20]|uniref:DUF4400 domain-containing protein n=1 Tax=Photobacterium pectinilyticum TaxID=2906793 RepID=A0ABT1N0Z5_9GAMM|nr:DUF4400 domain-containing protein [Photobacterium sp. ZSDE20]MCQ1058403.1 DUF4400 domain-containing protein [Photobacterium sp. ZSDE20]MDD1825234.1 DUF4400 domain-containing protein [Photobacterium sp. ZSDE20]